MADHKSSELVVEQMHLHLHKRNSDQVHNYALQEMAEVHMLASDTMAMEEVECTYSLVQRKAS